MLFYSTKRQSNAVGFCEALLQGQPADGGLFMPETIPQFSHADLGAWKKFSYAELAYTLSRLFVGDDIAPDVLRQIATRAYDWELPVRRIDRMRYVAELWHGPTLAFKDFAGRWLGQCIGTTKNEGPLTVLVATSGDTGSAVAAGFFGVPGVRVVILYPSGRVSHVQEQQLTTFGGNVVAVEVSGTFDDCQRLVKQAFADEALRREMTLTSANSISIGRLLPQAFYYVWSYLRVAETIGDPVIFSVPSGNVGNLTAGLLAKRMGLPVAQFITAVNHNTPLTDFLATGKYEQRASLATLSNAMDVGNPSNIVRIFDLYAKDFTAAAAPENVNMEAVRNDLWGSSVDDETTRATIKSVFTDYRYVMDPHTAVGWCAADRYVRQHDATLPLIVMSTAHPAKFIETVESILGAEVVSMPPQLAIAVTKKKQSIPIDASYDAVRNILKGQ